MASNVNAAEQQPSSAQSSPAQSAATDTNATNQVSASTQAVNQVAASTQIVPAVGGAQQNGVDIGRLTIPYYDPHMALDLLVSSYKGSKSTERKSEISVVLRRLLEIYPVIDVYKKLGWEVPPEATKEHQKTREKFLALEKEVTPLVNCIRMAREELSQQQQQQQQQGGGPNASNASSNIEKGLGMEPRGIQEWSSLWSARNVAFKASIEQELLKYAEDSERNARRAEIETGLEADFSPDVLSRLTSYCRCWYDGGDYQGFYGRMRFYLSSVAELVSEVHNDVAKLLEISWGALLSSLLCASSLLTSEQPLNEASINELDDISLFGCHVVKYTANLIEQMANDSRAAAASPQLGGGVSGNTQLAGSSSAPNSGTKGNSSLNGAASLVAKLPQVGCLNKITQFELTNSAYLLHWSIWLLFRQLLPRLLLVSSMSGSSSSSSASSSASSSLRNTGGGGPAVQCRQAVQIATKDLAEFVLGDRCLTVIKMMCPHLLRYCVVLCILLRSREEQCKAIAILCKESSYQDTFTLLWVSIYADMSFHKGELSINGIANLCAEDFLLGELKDSIEEDARLSIFDMYCKIHKSIDLNNVARQLGMDTDTAERWVISLIHQGSLDATIDSDKKIIQVVARTESVHKLLLEKSSNLRLRSQNLLGYLEARATTATGTATGQ